MAEFKHQSSVKYHYMAFKHLLVVLSHFLYITSLSIYKSSTQWHTESIENRLVHDESNSFEMFLIYFDIVRSMRTEGSA